MYFVGSPSHINSLFKTTPAISSNMAIVIGMKNVFGTPKDVLPLYAEDDSGQLATPVLGSHVLPENRMRFFHWRAAHQHLAGSNGIKLGERFMSILSRRISTDKSIGAEWVEMPDLFQFMQNLVFPAAIESLLGSTILSLHPTLNDDFWAFVSCMPTLLKGFPRWLSPLAYKRRDKMLKMIKEWHTFANKFSDFTKTEVNDPEWDQYLGSKYVKARQGIFHGIEMMNADGRASEDLGLLFA